MLGMKLFFYLKKDVALMTLNQGIMVIVLQGQSVSLLMRVSLRTVGVSVHAAAMAIWMFRGLGFPSCLHLSVTML